MELCKFRIRIGAVELEAEMNGSGTASLVLDALPIRAAAERWGDEIYFEIPIRAEKEPGAREVMEVGELEYWPPGSALCVFWGPTPASYADEPRAASPVNPGGRVIGDVSRLTVIGIGADIVIERA